MFRPLIPIRLLVLAGAKAQAEDFTGFYAGLNAGTGEASEHDRDAQTSRAGPNRIDPGYALPPSAHGATALLHRSQTAGNAPLGRTLIRRHGAPRQRPGAGLGPSPADGRDTHSPSLPSV